MGDARNWLIILLIVVVVLQVTGASPLANEEIIEWTDYRGEHMKVRVNRSLH